MKESLKRMTSVYGAILGMAWDVARGRSAGLAAAMIALGLTGAVLSYFTKLVVDSLSMGQGEQAFKWGVTYLCVFSLQAFMNNVLTLLQFDMGERISQEVDRRLMTIGSSVAGLEHLERPEFADKIKLVRERAYVPFAALANVNAVSYIVFGLAAALVLLGSIHPLLLLMPLTAIPTGWLQFRSNRKHFEKHDQTAPEERLARHYLELTTGIPSAKEMRVFGLGPHIIGRYKKLSDDYISKLYRDRLKRSGIGLISGSLYGASLAVAIGFIGWLAINGRATPGDVAMGVAVARMVIGHIEMSATMVAWLAELSFVGERYLWLLNYEPDVKMREKADLIPAPSRISKGITLEGVGFIYPGTEKRALEDVNLFIPAGSTVALVGENGAGKSSLIKLLCRFYDPSEGRILVDDVDLKDLDLDGWRDNTTVAFQDFVRFQLIAREAIGVGNLDGMKDGARVAAAARHAGATRVINKLPDGVDTQLGREFEGGVELSEGEWQRVALARGSMRTDPLLLILDEPTASLDARAEHEVFEQYAEMAHRNDVARPVCVLVSHRFSTVRMADLIVVMHEGTIEELGRHEELIARGGRYAELFQLQASRYD